jgi:membrane-associated protein
LDFGSLGYLLDPAGLLSDLLGDMGVWVYAVIFLIVFAETGLVFAPFLPGDSLLFAAGALAGTGRLELWVVAVVVITAAVAGDGVNYAIGRLFGKVIAARTGRIIKRRHIEAAEGFYERHGGKALVLARFVPVVRTFAPFVAGMGKMPLRRFWCFNWLGALGWTALFVPAGFFFGSLPWVERNLTLVVLLIVLVSVMPVVVKAGLSRRGPRRAARENV